MSTDTALAVVEMPRYKSHKTVWALKIAEVMNNGTDTTTDENPIVTLRFEDDRFAAKTLNLRGKPTPQTGWYYVQYGDGYWSFSPAPQFEEGNTPVPANHQDRVRVEKAELDGNIGRLESFTKGGAFVGLSEAEQERLSRQLRFMVSYSEALGERIAAF